MEIAYLDFGHFAEDGNGYAKVFYFWGLHVRELLNTGKITAIIHGSITGILKSLIAFCRFSKKREACAPSICVWWN